MKMCNDWTSPTSGGSVHGNIHIENSLAVPTAAENTHPPGSCSSLTCKRVHTMHTVYTMRMFISAALAVSPNWEPPTPVGSRRGANSAAVLPRESTRRSSEAEQTLVTGHNTDESHRRNAGRNKRYPKEHQLHMVLLIHAWETGKIRLLY